MLSLWSDRLTFISLCLLVFVLPASTAGVAIFAAGTIFFFIVKKIAALWSACKHPGGGFPWARISTALALPRPAAATSIAAGLFVLVCFLSIFISVQPSLSFDAFFGKTLKTVLLFFAVQECVTTPSRARWFLRVCLVSAFILCLDGVWQLYTGFDVFKHNAVIDGRINASFRHANGLGAYLIVMIPLFVVAAFSWAGRAGARDGLRLVKIVLAIVATALFMAVMGFTFSRGAWLGLACAGIVFLLFDRRIWVSCIVMAGLFLAFFYPLLINGRHVTLITDSIDVSGMNNMGGSGRIVFWNDALRIIGDHPILGTGLNTYTKVIRQTVEANQNYVHNCYLQVMAELGIVGLVALVGVFVAVFIFARRRILAEEDPESKLVWIALMAGWVGILIESSLDTTFYSAQLNTWLWVIMGLIVVFPFTSGKGVIPCSRK